MGRTLSRHGIEEAPIALHRAKNRTVVHDQRLLALVLVFTKTIRPMRCSVYEVQNQPFRLYIFSVATIRSWRTYSKGPRECKQTIQIRSGHEKKMHPSSPDKITP